VQAAVELPVETVAASAYTVPTEEPESDATLEWDATTIVVVEARAGGEIGLGYTYGHAAAAVVVDETLAGVAEGADATAPAEIWERLGAELRNAGRPGIGMTAVSAVDIALWDLNARLHGVSLASQLGGAHEALPVYGSGGFTSYSPARLREQLEGWVAEGIPRVKIKIGRNPEQDPARLDLARQAVGPDTELYVDANGGYSPKQALDWAGRLALHWGVTWFEEPVSSADAEGLRLVRERGPAGLDVAAGEYGYVLRDFVNLIGAVDCLQADVTRCGGITGLLAVGGLAAAHGLDLSAHTAPAVSTHALAAVPRLRHLEWFHDHVRVERLLFDGTAEPEGGAVRPDPSRPGLGLELRRSDAERWRVA
jgi:L-alanine-DL-glutamate epimerase-like enolase superfamily enzyme